MSTPMARSLEDIDKFKVFVDGALDPNSSPGLPFMRKGSTSAQAFGWQEALGFTDLYDLYFAVLERIDQLAEGPVMDPINLFVKHEPHKPSKVKNKAWRLISGVSVVDQLVDEILHGDFLDLVVDRPCGYNMTIGWSQYQEHGLRLINLLVRGVVDAADKSSWDWTVQPWHFELLEMFLTWLNDDYEPVTMAVMTNHLKAMGGPKEFRAKGRTFRTTEGGLMPSGWKLTILANSLMQIFSHYLACERCGKTYPTPLSQGDDTVQPAVDDESYWFELGRTGCILKDKQRFRCRTDGFEFCGMIFRRKSFHPVYLDKHAFHLRNIDPSVFRETVQSYQLLYLFDDDRLAALRKWASYAGCASARIDVAFWRRQVGA